MVWTTPPNRANEHKSWHQFVRGGCLWCHYGCDDCPNGVATCKCKVSKEERADELLNKENIGITNSWRE
jgi:hypothetical protein